MAWLADARRLSDDDQNRLKEYFDLAREVLVAAAERKRKLLESAANLNLHHLVQLPPESDQTLGTGS
jgi:RNase P subunit RPR2